MNIEYLTEAEINMLKPQPIIYTVELWRYDYVGDSRSQYWHTATDPYFISATEAEMNAWIDERNAAIVANQIVKYEQKITDKQTIIDNIKKKNALIDDMSPVEILTLGVQRASVEAIPRLETEIEHLRKKIADLETASTETIFDFGYVDYKWTAEPLEIKTIEQLDKETE